MVRSLGQNGATVGLPFAVYPSFIFYNQDLFTEAGLPLPPTKVGDMYETLFSECLNAGHD